MSLHILTDERNKKGEKLFSTRHDLDISSFF